MKFKSTLVLLAVFAILLAAVLVFNKKGTGPAQPGGPDLGKLVELKSADVEKITFKKETETLTFRKDDKGDWTIVEPMEANADKYEVGQLADNFSDLKIERIVEKEGGDLKKYQIPKEEVSIWVKGQEAPTKILIGMENPLDNTFFAQKEGDKRIVLIPSLLKTTLDKKLFDFRQKDIFKFETAEVKDIKLRAKDTQWEAQKKDDDWFVTSPLKALAKSSKVTTVLDSLSGLRAKEFLAENKTGDDLKKFGLDKPEYRVSLSLPKSNKVLTFDFHKDKDNKTYVTTSDSNKVVVPESDTVLTDLEKKSDDLRENKLLTFDTWQASKVVLKKEGLQLTATKSTNDKWYLDAALKEEADGSKVDTFVRKIEGLEAAEYIDAPKALAIYGLDQPQSEVTIWTKEMGEKPVEKSFAIQIGKVDKDKKRVIIKNPKLDYLFSVDSAFLDEFPKETKDWKAPEPEKKEPEKKEGKT